MIVLGVRGAEVCNGARLVGSGAESIVGMQADRREMSMFRLPDDVVDSHFLVSKWFLDLSSVIRVISRVMFDK